MLTKTIEKIFIKTEVLTELIEKYFLIDPLTTNKAKYMTF